MKGRFWDDCLIGPNRIDWSDPTAVRRTADGAIATMISHEFANDLTTEGEEKFEIKVFKDKEFTEQRGNTAYVTPESTLKTKNHRF